MRNDDSLKRLLKKHKRKIWWGVKAYYPKPHHQCHILVDGDVMSGTVVFSHPKRADCVREAIAYLGGLDAK